MKSVLFNNYDKNYIYIHHLVLTWNSEASASEVGKGRNIHVSISVYLIYTVVELYKVLIYINPVLTYCNVFNSRVYFIFGENVFIYIANKVNYFCGGNLPTSVDHRVIIYLPTSVDHRVIIYLATR